jgi:hypothetical protein
MEGQIFKIGQEVTLKRKIEWESVFGIQVSTETPTFGKVYTVVGYDTPFDGDEFILLEEIPGDSFNQKCFAPVISDEQLERDLEEIQLETQKS